MKREFSPLKMEAILLSSVKVNTIVGEHRLISKLFRVSNLKSVCVASVILCSVFVSKAQVVLNEASHKNYTQILDEDGETEDWIELYNTSDSVVNIQGWALSDNRDEPTKWVIPNVPMPPQATQLFFASDKDRTDYELGLNWRTAVMADDVFHYIIPDASVPSGWNTLDYDVQSWETGQAGFGYGDDDDVTVVPEGTTVIYVRKNFEISDTELIIDAICHVDYDDGFVAYLNGTEICRDNVDGTPTWSSFSAGNHDAVGTPDAFELDMSLLSSLLVQGDNVFAIEVHNVSLSSSDLSLIPYLSFQISDGTSPFSAPPSWMFSSDQSLLHTNFKISAEGEKVFLFNAQQVLVDSLDVDKIHLDHSIGRMVDGSDTLAVFMEATPGASNNSSTPYVQGYEKKPDFTLEAGFYSGTQQLIMYLDSESSPSSVIRYTTDGSTPQTDSKLYTESISISATQTINARCFSVEGQLTSNTRTASYFIDEEFTIPVLSVTTDSENLWGDDGIFTNYDEEWNKPCYVEYFDVSKELAFEQKAGIQVDGGAGGSRSEPQTSFRIEPGNGTFGDGDIDYALLPDRPSRDNYASFYMRNGSNRYLDLQYKDAAQVKGMGKGTFNTYSAYRPAICFINGEYYGMYEVREKINADYLESNYEMNTDSLVMVGISHRKGPRTVLPLVGTTESFDADWDAFVALDPESADYLSRVSEILDLDNYTDYIAGQTWMTNKDWPHNNMKAWKCEGTDMRWQFAIMDLEWSFAPTNSSANLATDPSFDQIDFMLGNGTDYHASAYWYMLMQNTDYKHYFINRLSDLMNTSYAYDVLSAIETQMYEEMHPEIPAYYERWDGNTGTFTSNHYAFNSDLSIREAYLREHLQYHYSLDDQISITLDVLPKGSGRIKISTITPEELPWTGDYFSDVPIKIEAIPNPGYTFKSWDDNKYISELSTGDFTGTFSDLDISFKANFEAVASAFNGITISEINYKDGDDFNTTDWFEIWNATDEVLDMEGWYFTDSDTTHRFDFTSVLIDAGERLVVTKNASNFTSNYPLVTNYIGEFSFGLGTPNDEINLYNSAGELVVQVSYSDIMPWPLANNAEGASLELRDPNSSLSDFNSWFEGCYMGSPGEAYVDCNAGDTVPSLLAENSIASGISIYPVPADDIINLKFGFDISMEGADIKIYNVMGALVMSASLGDVDEGESVPFDVSCLPGQQVYVIVVSSDELQQAVRMIKM